MRYFLALFLSIFLTGASQIPQTLLPRVTVTPVSIEEDKIFGEGVWYSSDMNMHLFNPVAEPIESEVAFKRLKPFQAIKYPPLARVGKIHGRILLQIIIGNDGHVSYARTISGPIMLRYACVEAAFHWIFALESVSPGDKRATIAIEFKHEPLNLDGKE